jgi:hypothetical protein
MLDKPESINSQATDKIHSYSEATQISHVSGWRASGMSISKYNAEHGISISALRKWIKYYADNLSEQSFKEVSLENGTLNYYLSYVGSMVEIKMPNGIQLKLPVDSQPLNWPKLLGILLQLGNLNGS